MPRAEQTPTYSAAAIDDNMIHGNGSSLLATPPDNDATGNSAPTELAGDGAQRGLSSGASREGGGGSFSPHSISRTTQFLASSQSHLDQPATSSITPTKCTGCILISNAVASIMTISFFALATYGLPAMYTAYQPPCKCAVQHTELEGGVSIDKQRIPVPQDGSDTSCQSKDYIMKRSRSNIELVVALAPVWIRNTLLLAMSGFFLRKIFGFAARPGGALTTILMPHGSAGTMTLAQAVSEIRRELDLDANLEPIEVASSARAFLGLQPTPAHTLKDDIQEICTHIGITPGWDDTEDLTVGEARDTIHACAGWKAIVGDGCPQPTWEHARQQLKLSWRQAFGISCAKLLFWHWSQPAAYLFVFWAYFCALAADDELPWAKSTIESMGAAWTGLGGLTKQQMLGSVVAARELMYFCSTLVALRISPVFLLLDMKATWNEVRGWQRVGRMAAYFLSPHTYVLLCMVKAARRFSVAFFVAAGCQIIADFASCLALFALLSQKFAGAPYPAALCIGYTITAAGNVFFFGPLTIYKLLSTARSKQKWLSSRVFTGVLGFITAAGFVYTVMGFAMLFTGHDVLCNGYMGQKPECGRYGQCIAGTCYCLNPSVIDDETTGEPCAIEACAVPYITLGDNYTYMSVHGEGGNRCDAPDNDGHREGMRYQGFPGNGKPTFTGIGGNRWYRFKNKVADALPLDHPGMNHCGTWMGGWVSDWDADSKQPPPHMYTSKGKYPQLQEGVKKIVVCFDGGNAPDSDCFPCGNYVTAQTIFCNYDGETFYLWKLPYFPTNSYAAYCSTWTNVACAKSTDPCCGLECGTRGTCVVVPKTGSGKCACDDGYFGDSCELPPVPHGMSKAYNVSAGTKAQQNHGNLMGKYRRIDQMCNEKPVYSNLDGWKLLQPMNSDIWVVGAACESNKTDGSDGYIRSSGHCPDSPSDTGCTGTWRIRTEEGIWGRDASIRIQPIKY
eukprot:COSAG01_NODE_3336_length_6236_cov_4.059801_3_plen_959_part_00